MSRSPIPSELNYLYPSFSKKLTIFSQKLFNIVNLILKENMNHKLTL